MKVTYWSDYACPFCYIGETSLKQAIANLKMEHDIQLEMKAFELDPEGSKHYDKFRRGRGHASGNGKTAGKGHKGQKARSGAPRPGFEGGQMPLYRRIPKRGFTNRNGKEIVSINLSTLEKKFENGATVDVEALLAAGIIKEVRDGVKVLGNGELTKKLDVKVNAFSATAKEKIEALGGTAEVI